MGEKVLALLGCCLGVGSRKRKTPRGWRTSGAVVVGNFLKIGNDVFIIGNEYLQSSVNRTNLSVGNEWSEKCYVTKVRRFAKGAVEVVTHQVNPLQQKRYSESAMLGGLIRKRKAMEPDLTPEEVEQLAADRAADNWARAVRRSKQQIRFGLKAIGADHLLTLTYRTLEGSPMADLDQLRGDFDGFRRLIKKGLPAFGKWKAHPGILEWRYVAVREKHENGSYHLHIGVSGRQDINFIRRCWFVAIGGRQDDAGENTKGNIDVRGPSKRWGAKTAQWRVDKLAGYMTKYLQKTLEEGGEPKGAKRYWAGRSNEKPELVRYWIGARDFGEAIAQSHAMFRVENQKPGLTIWASQGYDCIWLSG